MDKILVVDDEADIRRAFHRNLASDTLQVVDAGNGEDAIRMIAKERPNLVLMDIRMGATSGLDTLRKLRELPRQNLPLFIQAVVLLPVFGAAGWGVVMDNLNALAAMPLESVPAGARQAGASLESLIWKAAAVFLALGMFDYWRQRRRYMADLRMTKQEVRDEMKELEGNPQVKVRIRRLQRDLLRRRMMHQVPKATAVIVNPTHYAVAIRYAMEAMAAPVVVAKGKNYLAQRIRQKAVLHQVPIVENPPLAQALYKAAEVGQEIPAHLYRAVAEILAYIFKLMNGRLPG